MTNDTKEIETMNKILIIGPIPTTAGVGGVTIHVQRLIQYLENNSPNTCDLLDYKRISFNTLLNLIRKYNCIHIHFSNPYVRLIITLWACLFRTKVITTFHGNYCNLRLVKKLILTVTLKTTDIPIVINQPSFDYCILRNHNTILIPAFIPPSKEQPLNSHILALINNIQASRKLIISTNASGLSYDENGNETYGIKFLINFFNNKPDTMLLISDPTGQNKEKYESMAKNVMFISYPHSYYEILKRVDISIRNTSTDGDSLSVKESLYLGCRTICSDVVNRPAGCYLFHYNDAGSLTKAIEAAMEADNVPMSLENGAVQLNKLYNSILTS